MNDMKLNVNELRIGNYLQGDKIANHNIQMYSDGIIEISAYGIYMISENKLDTLLPIKLDTKILSRLGFEKNESSIEGYENWFVVSRLKYYFDLIIEDGVVTYVGASCTVILRYVHQLQNLFYAITNEELKFNITMK